MKKIISALILSACIWGCNNEKSNEVQAPAAAADKAPAPVELLNDSVMVNNSKAAFAAFENKDIEAYTANMDEKVMFRWSGCDSLAGKQAVKDYYLGRFAIIRQIKFSEHILLPLKANVSPNGGVTSTGKWMLSWYRTDVTYTNNKSITFWAHNAQHYNDAGKIDQMVQYIDRLPILEASKDLVKK